MKHLYRTILVVASVFFLMTSASYAMADSVDENCDPVPTAAPSDHEGGIMPELALVYGQNMIAIGDTVDDEKIEGALGKPVSAMSHTYSKYDGLNNDPLEGMIIKRYTYPGLVVEAINTGEDDRFVVSSIEITDMQYITPRSISVGDSLERLRLAYPEGTLLGGETTDDDYRYQPSEYWKIMNFHIKDGKVESIHIYMLLD